MGLFNWFSTKVDGSTVNACRMDLERVKSLCNRSDEYKEAFSHWFAEAVDDFDIKRVVLSAGASLDYDEVKASAIRIKNTAGQIALGNKAMEEALSMMANWIMLAALSHHSDAHIAYEAHALERDYETFASQYSPCPAARIAPTVDNERQAEDVGALIATSVGTILNTMSSPPAKRCATVLEALLNFAAAMKKLTGKEFIVEGSCVHYIVSSTAQGNDSDALLALDQLAIRLKHAHPANEAPGIFLKAFTKPYSAVGA